MTAMGKDCSRQSICISSLHGGQVGSPDHAGVIISPYILHLPRSNAMEGVNVRITGVFSDPASMRPRDTVNPVHKKAESEMIRL